ncbi:transporter, anaerobic C4-dicarboxylate uptake family protein [Yersinia pseudotuberculosis]|uniref:C4-dicarboxylate transporter n=4 Tax=Yersinia pseudotuberculosis complex TaxID=1649845 RepID=A0A0U1QVS0_YERP3|nr:MULTISPECIES: anaerobic C4-dicarboxylate transporter [Yersinia pseudotuberculosis complex]CQD54577.1 anaerobic C4-dicarboxylate transporter [Yersinia intermedia]ABS46614.1 anaerobic C4-dicarboxylate transporter dcuB [Yersinia pseudotuberculosis IP 31758]AJJ01997.1 transporter, anaerobic C4-dicarboxylate uptake family protein [Yersinia pseudotuberculosis]AJJ68639.1 transporter, anaerobic C4-dicarboxylate uptake family protein [Yersinia pseudotuberculosis PB1/+]AJJ72367.1 transporter, anaerob
MITLQFIIIILCLLLGTRYGGMGLGLISGIGLFILTFIFGLEPGKPPVDVMLTILAVIGCASVLQTAGGLNVMMQFAERLLRRHPQHITLLAPFTTWSLTFLCGTGHVVYTMFPIISDIAIKKGIRPERPMAVASVASQMAITASPVSVAVVSLVSIIGANHGIGHAYSILEILAISVPASLVGVLIAALWSLRRGKDLDKDPDFQKKIKDPEQRAYIYGSTDTLLNQVFPKQAYWSTWIFFAAIVVVVLLGAFADLRPAFEVKGKLQSLSMNLVIQMMMLIAGAVILIGCKVKPSDISNGAVFKAGMVAIFSVFGVAWMSDTFFQAHMGELRLVLEDVVKGHPWTYAIVLFLVSKLVNSQAAALAAIAPMGLQLGVEPKMLIAFFPAAYGYFVLPTYPSDLACIGFDRSGTTKIGRFIINHSFIIPGLIGVICSCITGYLLVTTFM